MTNRFHLSLDSWGTKLVALAMFAFLATNTWHFISTFIPADTWYHRPAMFTFFEGGLLYWFNRLEHASENVGKTIIAALMTLIQLAAVGFATLYELSVGFQQMMGFHMDTTIQFAMPFVVSGLIIVWIIAWALGRLFNQHFAARIGYIARTGVAPHVAGVDVAMLSADGLPARTALPGARARGGQRALPSPRNGQGAQGSQGMQGNGQGTTQTGARAAQGTQTGFTQTEGTGARAWAGNALARAGAWFQGGAKGRAKEFVQVTEESADPMQEGVQDDENGDDGPDTGELNAQGGAQQNSTGQRAPSAHRKPANGATTGTRTRTRTPSKNNAQLLIPLLVAQYPNADNAYIARLAGCAPSTVSRWRAANQGQPVQTQQGGN